MPAAARAEGLSGFIEPAVGVVENESTDQAGAVTRAGQTALTQRYQLRLDRSVTDALSAGLGGTLLDERAWARSRGISSELHARSTTIFGRLSLSTPVLTAGVGVDRAEQETLGSSATGVVTTTYAGSAAWRPLDLPDLQLRLARVDSWDRTRLLRDATADTAQVAARLRAQRYEVSYLLGWTRSTDRLHAVRTTSIDQTARATRSDSLLGGRTSTYLSGSLQARSTSVSAEGQGGTVTVQQLPANGLSAVLAPPATPGDVVLAPNAALVDGNTTTSAGVNVGFGVAAGGDVNAREVGVAFGDAVSDVNTIHLWVHRPLAPAVIAALAASVQVRASNDNRAWTVVPLDGPPGPGDLDNRIELSIPQTRARYVKVTLQPLAPGVTVDESFRDVFVTELQVLLVLPIASVPRSFSGLTASGTAIVRTTLLRAGSVAHDLTASGTYRDESPATSYAIANGLSATERLSRTVAGRARVARQDSNDGGRHQGAWSWSAGVAGTPVPAASWSLSYDGSYTDEDVVSHNLNASTRGDLYEGVSAQVNGGYALIAHELQVAQTFVLSSATTLSPNRRVTLTAGGLYSRSTVNDAFAGISSSHAARADGTLSVTPAPAVSVVGTVTRVLLGARPSTFATLTTSWAPLRGDLQLSMAYSRTLSTDSETTTERLSPVLRWNVRSGVSLTAAYLVAETASPVQTTNTRSFSASLLVAL